MNVCDCIKKEKRKAIKRKRKCKNVLNEKLKKQAKEQKNKNFD